MMDYDTFVRWLFAALLSGRLHAGNFGMNRLRSEPGAECECVRRIARCARVSLLEWRFTKEKILQCHRFVKDFFSSGVAV
jgi:hypothetical protein